MLKKRRVASRTLKFYVFRTRTPARAQYTPPSKQKTSDHTGPAAPQRATATGPMETTNTKMRPEASPQSIGKGGVKHPSARARGLHGELAPKAASTTHAKIRPHDASAPASRRIAPKAATTAGEPCQLNWLRPRLPRGGRQRVGREPPLAPRPGPSPLSLLTASRPALPSCGSKRKHKRACRHPPP